MNITDIEYSINGGNAQSSGQTEFPITINTTGAGSRSVRVRTRAGSIVSPWSNSMSGTPIVPPSPGGDRIWGQWEFDVEGNFPNLADYSSTDEWTFNVGKSAARGAAGRVGTINRGLKYVPHVSTRVDSYGESSARSRCVNYVRDYASTTSPDDFAFIHLIDEPRRKGTSYAFLESIIQEGRQTNRNGPEFKYGFTINAAHLRDLNSGNPEMDGQPNPLINPTVDYILFQYYPFRNPDHPDWSQSETAVTKTQFMNLGATRIAQLRGHFPNSEVIIVAQSFYGEHDKFIKPPDDAPFWYAELAEVEDIAGTIWWTRVTKGSGSARTYGSDRGEFETFRNNMELAYNQYIKQ